MFTDYITLALVWCQLKVSRIMKQIHLIGETCGKNTPEGTGSHHAEKYHPVKALTGC